MTSSQEEEMIKEIKKLYDDKSAQVVIATAITLFTINHADEKVQILIFIASKAFTHRPTFI